MPGFVAGAVARALTPGDAFSQMSGPASWGFSLVLGRAGAWLGWWFFTGVLGIGDAETLDWGAILGAAIAVIAVTLVASFVLRPSSFVFRRPAARREARGLIPTGLRPRRG